MKRLAAILCMLLALPASAQVTTNPIVTGIGVVAIGSTVRSGTANSILYISAAGALTQDTANFQYTTASGPRLQVGSGSTTSSGWIFGYGPSSGYSGIYSTAVGTPDTVNYAIHANSATLFLNAPTATGVLRFRRDNTTIATLGAAGDVAGVAGAGYYVAAGTAASPVSALSITQEWNYNTAAIDGIDVVFTDTSSHANTNALRIRGGPAGTTELLTVNKSGNWGLGTATPATPDGTNALDTSFGRYISLYGDAPAIHLISSTITSGKQAAVVFGRTGGTTNEYRASIRYGQDTDHLGLYAGGGTAGAGTLSILGLSAIGIGSGTVFGLSSTGEADGTPDVGISRKSANHLAIGTGAAGSVAGYLALKGINSYSQTTDAAPPVPLYRASNAYAQAATNTAGADLVLGPGIGRRFATVVDYSLIDATADSITLVVSQAGSAAVTTVGLATAATQDGTNWIIGGTNDATATNICTWAATVSGVTATAVTDKCYITPASTTHTVTLTTNADAGELTVTSGTDGLIQVGKAVTAAAVAANFSATHYIPIKDGLGTTYYLPVDVAAW